MKAWDEVVIIDTDFVEFEENDLIAFLPPEIFDGEGKLLTQFYDILMYGELPLCYGVVLDVTLDENDEEWFLVEYGLNLYELHWSYIIGKPKNDGKGLLQS